MTLATVTLAWAFLGPGWNTIQEAGMTSLRKNLEIPVQARTPDGANTDNYF
jgi:hypothetical protein